MGSDFRELAAYRKWAAMVGERWTTFQQERAALLVPQQQRFGRVAEKAAENVVGALFTTVLGWKVEDLNWQLDRADLVITRNTVKYLVVETKRPGSLATERSQNAAMEQAWRYATKQRVKQVAVCDGILFYGADIIEGGLQPRVLCDLTASVPSEDTLWWVSLDGIYRACEARPDPSRRACASTATTEALCLGATEEHLLHPKYQIPANCFAYVGDPAKPATWKLPYLLIDGSPDLRRLPKAIGALATNYRGTKVGGIPEAAIPEVFRRLGVAAARAGKQPAPGVTVAPAYLQLAEILAQLEAAGQ